MAVKAISFDFWDTIFKMENEFDPKTIRIEKMKFLIKRFNIEPDEKQLSGLYSEVWERFDKEWHENYRTMKTEEIIAFVLERLNITLPQTAINSLVEIFQEAILKNPPELIDNVKEAIVSLSKNYKLAIISDTGFTPGRVLRKILKMNELLEYFDILVFSDEFGKSKPHTDTFNHVINKLGLIPSEIVHIGDNERTDIGGALSAGMKSILFTKNRDYDPLSTKANAIMKNWNEIKNILYSF